MADKKAKPTNVKGKTPERMDIRTIARAANVSIATVSRTMNHVPTVNPKMAKRKVHLVFIDVGPKRPSISLLKVDYHHGIRQGVQHLAALGHRDIAFITGPMTLHSAQSRQVAFSTSLKECGIAPDPAWIIEGDHTMERGVASMKRLLAPKTMPTPLPLSPHLTPTTVLPNPNHPHS